MSFDASYTDFDTTEWTLVDDLCDECPERRRAAETELCETYWPCVYSFYRAAGHSREGAQDLVQAFFTTVVLHRELFQKADRTRGSLRSLLRTALRNFEIEQFRKEGRSAASFTISESAFRNEDSILTNVQTASAPDSFDRRWAVTLVAEARDLCESHFCKRGKQEHWRLFRHRILDPSTQNTQPSPLKDIFAVYGFDSEKSRRSGRTDSQTPLR